jgi:anti-sigma regulatory factor (Ser/Thr protein kinase)
MPLSSAVEGSSLAPAIPAQAPSAPFRHHVLCYANGDRGFLDGTLELVRDAVARDAGVLVAVGPARAQTLSEALGNDAACVRFVDMRKLGRNPARIIPAWREFIRESAGTRGDALGIGEPVWPGRSAAELDECARHEALLNLAFDDGPGWQLLCSYDLDGLDDAVIEAARHAHPLLGCDGIGSDNDEHIGAHEPPHPFAGALPAPGGAVKQLAFACGSLARLRRVVCDWATQHALDVERTEELVLAVDELAANSIRHGGGSGTLRCWREGDVLLCEVQDAGSITEPLVGRSRPAAESLSGRGVWLVNQLCDLVQIRSLPGGGVVRVHKRLS